MEDDGYIHWYLISHLLEADQLSCAVALLQDLYWIEQCSLITGPARLISSYKKVVSAMQLTGVDMVRSLMSLVGM